MQTNSPRLQILDDGRVTELRCSVDPDTKSGSSGGRRIKGTVHVLSTPEEVEQLEVDVELDEEMDWERVPLEPDQVLVVVAGHGHPDEVKDILAANGGQHLPKPEHLG